MLSLRSFRHGIHPGDHKELTAHLPIVRMPFVRTYVLPLGQHLGAPARAIVEVGQKVARGQRIADPGGFVSTALHAPVSGKVVAIGPRRHPNGQLVTAIEIEASAFSTQEVATHKPPDWRQQSRADFVREVQNAGLVGMGGAAFPTHVKYNLAEGKRCRELVVNGAECEPYLTCDHRLMVERPEAVMRGIEISLAQLGAERATVGIEANKPDAAAALRAAIPKGLPVEVVPLTVKYPQGAEKMLIKALFGREVPAGKLPLDIEVVVNNVGTMAAIGDYFYDGVPLIERVVTVSGPGVREPQNLLVPIGTSVKEVLAFCGGVTDDVDGIVMGGPMMGSALASLEGPVLKGTSGILAFTKAETGLPDEYPCIRCGQCLEACANFLNPSRLGRLAKAGLYDEMQSHFVFDCMECGACSFTCPSGIPLVQLIRTAKAALRERKKVSA